MILQQVCLKKKTGRRKHRSGDLSSACRFMPFLNGSYRSYLVRIL